MKAGGSIVNISSLAGIRSAQKFTGYVPYIISKFGVVGLTEALAEEGRAKGIRVNCVAPGAVETDMLKLWDPHIKTNASAKDLAQVVVRVAELGMTILTGATIEVPTSVWRDH
jgi:NAD(P)-dependent dehydrogenase (short-subunit alcohol dehydrogenase family)